MITFCIPWRTDNSYREVTFQFVTQTLRKEWPEDEILVADTGSKPFSRSASRNAAAKMATGDVLVFLDADSYVSLYQLRQAVGRVVTEGAPWGFPYDFYYSLTAPGTTKFMMEGKVDEDDIVFTFPGPDPFDRPASVGGCVVVSKVAFEEVKGYDERFIGWSFEDRAFAYALEGRYGPAFRVPGALYHLWHPEPEKERFGQPRMEANRTLANLYRDAVDRPEVMGEIIANRS